MELGLSAPLGIAASSSVSELYDYYYPMHGKYLNSQYRQWFDQILHDEHFNGKDDKRIWPVFKAVRGDAAAFHAFANAEEREGEGEFGETWTWECLLLLLRLGDDRFAELLAKENKATREIVGMSIDVQVDWTKHQFPKTRALYAYRYVRPSAAEIARRMHGPPSAMIPLNRSEEIVLRAALATQERFANVDLNVPKGAPPGQRADATITVRAPFSKKQLAELTEFIRSNAPANIVFK
jgi:hypothetical protein